MGKSSQISRPLLLVLFLVIGVVLTAWEPTRRILIGPIWLGFTVLITILAGHLIVRAWRLDRLRRRGTAAQARASSMVETKLMVKEMPQMRLGLEVQAPWGAYEASVKTVVPVSALEGLRRGDLFPVKLDPGDRERIAFDWEACDWGQVDGPPSDIIARGLGAPAKVDPATRLAQLDSLKAHSDMPREDYERLRREIEADL